MQKKNKKVETLWLYGEGDLVFDDKGCIDYGPTLPIAITTETPEWAGKYPTYYVKMAEDYEYRECIIWVIPIISTRFGLKHNRKSLNRFLANISINIFDSEGRDLFKKCFKKCYKQIIKEFDIEFLDLDEID